MPTFIALYRGINVGGKNSVKMEALRALHERLGHGGAANYIQSGNIVFSAKGAAKTHAKQLIAAFEEEFGFAARLLVVDAQRWGEIVAANPYARQAKQDPKTVHAALGAGKPDAKALAALLAKTGGRESFSVAKDVIYLHAPDGFGTSKFAAGLERAAGVPVTVRNWRTMEALWEMAQAATASSSART